MIHATTIKYLTENQAASITGGKKSKGPYESQQGCESNWGAGRCSKAKDGTWWGPASSK